jgi:hypothetical protein
LLIASVMMLELLLFVTWDLMTICSVDSFLMWCSIPTQEEGLCKMQWFLKFYLWWIFLPFCKNHFEKKFNFFFTYIHFFLGKEKKSPKYENLKFQKKKSPKITNNFLQ